MLHACARELMACGKPGLPTAHDDHINPLHNRAHTTGGRSELAEHTRRD
jgi:hypothetical protein